MHLCDWNADIEALNYALWRPECRNRGSRVRAVAVVLPQSWRTSRRRGDWKRYRGGRVSAAATRMPQSRRSHTHRCDQNAAIVAVENAAWRPECRNRSGREKTEAHEWRNGNRTKRRRAKGKARAKWTHPPNNVFQLTAPAGARKIAGILANAFPFY